MKHDSPFAVVTLTFLTLSATVLLFILWPDGNTGFENLLCRGDTCTVQGWLSALSGLIAAGAAGLTLTPLWLQVREASKQTSFIVGEEPPILELTPVGWGQSGRFRVVNWNRQGFYICEIRWHASVPIERSADVHVNEMNYSSVEPDGTLPRRMFVSGWEDRNGPPPSLTGAFGFSVIDGHSAPLRSAPIARLELVGYLSGERRKKVTLWAEAPIRETELNTDW